MKRFNKNIILFIASFLIIIFGFNSLYLEDLFSATKDFTEQCKTDSFFNSFIEFKDDVENIASKKIRYRDVLMNINSLKDNIINTRIITKDEDVIVKTDNGYLVKPQDYISDNELDQVVEKIQNLYNFTAEEQSKFLYVAAPQKGYGVSLPKNVDDHRTDNYDRFINKMELSKIPMLDLTNKLVKENKYSEELFFVTDHHWTPKTAFWANEQVCKKLNEFYNFKYDTNFLDLTNYNIKTYNNYFLGSYGKKTGLYFAKGGADDIDIITPKFDTKLVEEQPLKSQTRSGDFTQTVMYIEYVQQKDYYNLNPYATYSGGDFRLQIIKNELNPNGEKILLIRDSFACALTPFLALNTSELHVVDIRDFDYFVGEKINVYEYIKTEKPDYVVVLYNGVESIKGSNQKFEFN